MSKLKYHIPIILFSLFFFSNCSDSGRETGIDCVFVQNDEDMDGLIDDTERSIMNECLKDAFTKREDIEKNLIGEWELVGHGEGWVATVSQPCGYLIFSESTVEVSFNDGSTDTTFSSEWALTTTPGEAPLNNLLSFGAEAKVNFYFNVFCEDYMYTDNTPVDGNMYLFEKVN